MFSLWITMCNKSAMCKLPENSTILGYGLSYESDLTRGLSNSELQQKINELHQPRVQSPPGVYRCIVCGQPLQAEERATEKRACHSDCAKFLDRIVQIVSSTFNMKPNGAPIDLTYKPGVTRSIRSRELNLRALGCEDLDTLLSHPIYGRFAALRFRNGLSMVLKHRLERSAERSAELGTEPVSSEEITSWVLDDAELLSVAPAPKPASKCSSSKNPTKNPTKNQTKYQKGFSKNNSICKALDKKGANPLFQGITSRELIDELQSRGYKWDAMWVEEVEVKRRYVKM